MTLNMNQATQEELEALPGIGPATAEKLMKARPIAGAAQLEELIPPSAWLKIQEEGVEFAFGDADRDPADNDVEGLQPRGDAQAAPPAIPQPAMKMHGPEMMVVRRLMPGQELQAGKQYLCVWNVMHGPQGEARMPEDEPVQAYITGWFQKHNMDIQFAHYGPSVRLTTPNRGLVNLVLFEIIKEEKGEADEGYGDG